MKIEQMLTGSWQIIGFYYHATGPEELSLVNKELWQAKGRLKGSQVFPASLVLMLFRIGHDHQAIDWWLEGTEVTKHPPSVLVSPDSLFTHLHLQINHTIILERSILFEWGKENFVQSLIEGVEKLMRQSRISFACQITENGSTASGDSGRMVLLTDHNSRISDLSKPEFDAVCVQLRTNLTANHIKTHPVSSSIETFLSDFRRKMTLSSPEYLVDEPFRRLFIKYRGVLFGFVGASADGFKVY